MLTPQDIYTKTNDGLDIIVFYYPQALESSKTKKPFKKREENTASTHIKKFNDCWRVTDFGDDGHAQSPIDIVMDRENVNFYVAVCILANRYNIEQKLSHNINKPGIEKRSPKKKETEGSFFFQVKKQFTESELKILGPKVTQETCDKYNYKSVEWFSRTKNGETTVIKSTEHFPIFMRECGEFRKFYQPLNPDKQYRFFYEGTKPKSFINGLDELKKAYQDFNNNAEKEFKKEAANEGKPFSPKKLDEAIICSGERDALNVASMGYFPLWFNSESYLLQGFEYSEITKYVERIYNIPDIDTTGLRKGAELAMQYIDIYTVWLPPWLRNYKDMRGKQRKDLRDYIELRPSVHDFKNLLKTAMPVKFWECKLGERGYRNEINSEYLFHFLKLNGFGLIENKNSKNGYSFARIEKNIVRDIKPKDIKAFCRDFLKTRFYDVEIMNLVNNSTRVGESAFECLDKLEPNFIDYDANRQFLFLQNKTFEITADEIRELNPLDVDRHVWDDEVVKHNVKRIEESFNIDIDSELYKIQIHHTKSNFFKFLINTSRVHWRKEFEERVEQWKNEEKYSEKFHYSIDGPLLTAEEIQEQKEHLINKIFTIGYLLHRYKSPSRAWCVYEMDNVIGDDGENNGRSGKSFFISAFNHFMKTVILPGRNPRLTDNPHMLDRVTEHTDLLIVDDASEFMQFSVFYDSITGDTIVNPKNNQSYSIPFEKSPKIAITTNFVLKDRDPSTEGRLLYIVFSDYYHIKAENNQYNENRSVYDDFNGKNLMKDDYSETDWNNDINFFADCCKFYLSTCQAKEIIKIQPPMGNISQRRHLAIMGMQFKDWADVYFSVENGKVNSMIPRTEVFQDFVKTTNSNKITMQGFTRKLRAYCRENLFIKNLNPGEYQNAQGRIIRRYDEKATEMIYIQTIDAELDQSEILNSKEENKPL